MLDAAIRRVSCKYASKILFTTAAITPTLHTPSAHYNSQISQHWCRPM